MARLGQLINDQLPDLRTSFATLVENEPTTTENLR
jgi:hypothetical protein